MDHVTRAGHRDHGWWPTLLGEGSAIPRRVAFINEKGGSGKTTLVANLAAYLAGQRGHRTLAVDMDPQGQLGKVLGLECRSPHRSAIELLVDGLIGEPRQPIESTRRRERHRSEALDDPLSGRRSDDRLPAVPTRVPLLDVIVANKALALFPAWTGCAREETEMDLRLDASARQADTHDPFGPGATRRLADRLDAAPDLDAYDFVLVDAPPSFGALTLNILRACNEVVIPVPLTYLALDGCAELLRTIAMVRTELDHPDLRISMVVPTFHRRTKLAAEILDKLKARFPKEIAQTVVGYHVKIDEAQSRGLSIFEYAPRDRGAAAMAALAEELETRGQPAAAQPGSATRQAVEEAEA